MTNNNKAIIIKYQIVIFLLWFDDWWRRRWVFLIKSIEKLSLFLCFSRFLNGNLGCLRIRSGWFFLLRRNGDNTCIDIFFFHVRVIPLIIPIYSFRLTQYFLTCILIRLFLWFLLLFNRVFLLQRSMFLVINFLFFFLFVFAAAASAEDGIWLILKHNLLVLLKHFLLVVSLQIRGRFLRTQR